MGCHARIVASVWPFGELAHDQLTITANSVTDLAGVVRWYAPKFRPSWEARDLYVTERLHGGFRSWRFRNGYLKRL